MCVRESDCISIGRPVGPPDRNSDALFTGSRLETVQELPFTVVALF